MKNSHALGLVVTSVLVTAGVQEFRMSSLRKSVEASQTAVVPESTDDSPTIPADGLLELQRPAPPRTKSSAERPTATPAGTPDESFATTARKMLDNPAGKSMLNQQAKMMVTMTYQDLIDGMGLSKEESDYFKELLGREAMDQQELGLKMLGGTPEEMKTLAEELEKRSAATQDEIKKFLN
ncbi:MAG: hypothetical protein EOP85_02495, partial [Verrucomicrobiaceae bacterium]